MKVIHRTDAVAALASLHKVDLGDWLDASYPDAHVRHLAVVVVELQLEIMTAMERASYYAERLAHVSADWRNMTSAIASYSQDLDRLADRIRALTSIRDLAIVPFLPRKEG